MIQLDQNSFWYNSIFFYEIKIDNKIHDHNACHKVHSLYPYPVWIKIVNNLRVIESNPSTYIVYLYVW